MRAGLVALVLCGCSVLNSPNRGEIIRPVDSSMGDARVDSGADADDRDAGPLDGNASCVPSETRELTCTGGADEDCDGDEDCADLDCASAVVCCEAGMLVIDEDWSSSYNWRDLPPGETPDVSGDGRVTFGTDGVPRAFEARDCVPLVFGLTLYVELYLPGTPPVCPRTDPECENFSALVLTAASDLVLGQKLPDELAVVLNHDGELTVERGGAPISAAASVSSDLAELRLTLTPGTIGETGRAVLVATVEDLSTSDVLLPPFELLDQSQLLSDELACPDGPGLYVAIEGVGTAVAVGPVQAEVMQCANPSHFERSTSDDLTITSSLLDLGGWAQGGIGAPALASFLDSTTRRWDLLVDATNTQRANEFFLHVGYAVGGAFSTSDDMDDWTARVLGATGLGSDPPACSSDGMMPPGGCDAPLSFREPTLVAPALPDGTLASGTSHLPGAAARELGTDETRRDRFAIHFFDVPLREGRPFSYTDADPPILTPDDTAGCESLRDPLLLARAQVEDDTGGYWLFYTCERGPGAPSRIDVVALDDTGAATGTPPRTALDASVGPYAASGVYGPEGLVMRLEDGTVAYRLWFMAAHRGTTTISMAYGRSKPGQAELPALTAYPGNPVLEAQSTTMGDCSGTCLLEGFAVARPGGDLVNVRFLVARSVNDELGSRYELVPLDQVWRSPP